MLFWLIGSVEVYAQNDGAKKTPVKQSQPKRIHSSKIIREKLSLSIGSHYSHGEYSLDKSDFSQSNASLVTEILNIPFSISYKRDNWRVSAKISYLYISGPARVIAISDGVEVVETISEGRRQRWGNGDLRLKTQYQLPSFLQSKARGHIGVSIKVPVASEKGSLGTGEFDYSLFGGAYLRTGYWLTNARIGYQFMGDTRDTEYRNRWYTSLGGYYLFNRAYSAGFNAYYKQAASESSESIRTLSTYINWRLPKGWRCNFSIGTGFSESSADLFGGFQVTKTFARKRHVSRLE